LAISPNGREIVYVAEGYQLYWRSLDDLQVKAVPGSEGAFEAFFSSDGEWLGFNIPGGLKKVSLKGGVPSTVSNLAGLAAGASWGAEDTILLSVREESGSAIYRVSAMDGEFEIVARPDLDKGEDRYTDPEFLPGSRTVLFTLLGDEGYQVAALSLESGEHKTLVDGGRQAHYLLTGHLVYEQSVTGTLMVAPFDLSRLEVTGNPVPLVEGVRYNPAGAVDYAVSSGGTLVYVPRRQRQHQLVWVERDGTEHLVTEERRNFATPRISPDGTQVSVTVYENDGRRDVWIYSIKEDSFRRLPYERDFSSTQIWSADGQWIAYQSGSEGRRGIYRQLADGTTQAEQLITPGPFSQIADSWSPDGSDLVFTTGGLGIWLLPVKEGGEPRPLITSNDLQCCAAISPDGERLAYVAVNAGQTHVYVSPYGDPKVKLQVSDTEGSTQPVWSPDGTELFYLSRDRMMAVSIRTEPVLSISKPRLLFKGSYLSSQFTQGKQYYDVSPDGQRFLMIREAEETQINVVLNWFEELKRLVPVE
jgi:Tol biopolymer transport system component